MIDHDRSMTRPAVVGRMAIGVVAASFGAIFVRFAGGASPLAIAAWRLAIAAAVLAPGAVLRLREGRSMNRSTLAWSLVSGIALALHFMLWISSLRYTTVANSVLFVTTHPLFVAVGSVIFLRERLTRPLLVGGSLAVLGGAIIGLGDLDVGGTALRGDLLALGGGLSVAVYFLIGRHVRQTVSLVEYAATAYGSAAVVVLAVAFVTGTRLVGFSSPTYASLLLLALVPQLIGHSTFNWALEHLPASRVSVLILGEPVGSAVLAFLFFREAISGLNGIGAGIILVGIYLSLRTKEDSDGNDHRAGQD